MSHRLLLAMACAMVWAVSPAYAQDTETDRGSDGIAQLIPMSDAKRGGAVIGDAMARAGLADRVGRSVKRAVDGMVDAVGALIHINVRGGPQAFQDAIEVSQRTMATTDALEQFLGKGHGLSPRQLGELTDAMNQILDRASTSDDPESVLRRSAQILQRETFVPQVIERFLAQEEEEVVEVSQVVDTAHALDEVSQAIQTRITDPINQSVGGSSGGDVETYRHVADAVGRMGDMARALPVPAHMSAGMSAAMDRVERSLLARYHQLRGQTGAPNQEFQLLETYRALTGGEGHVSPHLDPTALAALRDIAGAIQSQVADPIENAR